MYVSKTFVFEASHQIANHPGKCRRLHGHSWVLVVTCQGKLDPETKMVKDFYLIKEAVQPIIDRLDHQHLGCGEVKVIDEVDRVVTTHLFTTVEGMPIDFLPTSENMLIWIASQFPTDLPWCKLELKETCTSNAILERWEFSRYHERREDTHGRQEGHEEGNEEGKEVAQEGQEVTLIDRTHITDDDIPF